MRLPGICTECRQFRQVRVSGSAYARVAATSRHVEGICLECEDEKYDRRVGLVH